MASAQDIGPTPDALRIVLVGKPGCGKSSTGNTILGRKEFGVKADGSCVKAESEVDGRRVAVVDTPGLCDTSLSNEETVAEMCKSFTLLAPGPHAFLLLLKIGRFTPEEKCAVQYIKKAFGKEAEKYIMVLFTRGDDLEEDDTTIEDYLDQSDPALKELISDCANRFHVFNNRKKDRTQVKELLQKIDHMVKENGGSYYTNDMLREAEEAIQREVERLLKEKEEEIRRKYQEEMEKILQVVKKKLEEENRQREKQFRDKEEELKREQEQKKGEEEFREMERRCEEETKLVKRRYAEEARRKAEQSNSFLDKILSGLAKMVDNVIEFFRNL